MGNIKINKDNIWDIVGAAVGVITVIVGIVFLFQGDTMGSSSMRDITFGADFYTEIYGVTNGIYNRMFFLLEAVERISKGFGWLFVFFGALDIVVFGKRLTSTAAGPAATPVEEAKHEKEDTAE